MNVDKLEAYASKLSDAQLQQEMRNGSLPPYIGYSILKQRNDLRQQSKAAQGAAQPKPPTVAQQVEGEAQQANIEDLMRQRAAMMQGQMAGTGGISDMLRKPEPEAMAKGGEVKHFYEGGPVTMQRIALKQANGEKLTPEEEAFAKKSLGLLSAPTGMRAPDYHPATSDKGLFRKDYTWSEPQNMQALTTKLAQPQGVDIPAYTPIAIQDQDIPLQTQPTIQNISQPAPAQRTQVIPAANAPTAGTQIPYGAALTPTQNSVAQGLTALYNDAIAQNPIVTAEQARKQREEYLGPNTGIASLREDVNKIKDEATKDKEQAGWMALMKAGLATMAGTSPYALTNIGQGAQAGVTDFMDAQKEYRKALEKQRDLSLKLDIAERQEKIDTFKYGEDSEKASRSANTALKIGQAKEENDTRLKEAELDLRKQSNAISAAAANRPTEATMAMDLATATAALKGEKDPEKRAMLENRIEGLKTGLSSMNMSRYGGDQFKTGVELRALVDDTEKRLNEYVKSLGFRGKQPQYLASDENYKRLLNERNEAAAAHRRYVSQSSNLLDNSSVTPPPAGGVQSSGDGWGNVQVH